MNNLEIRTVNFVIFKRRLTAEIRNYWYCRTSFEYSARWWKEGNKVAEYEYITKYPGDSTQVFNSIDIPPTEYVSAKDDVLWSVRGNAITNIVTAFETYLYYQIKRAIYLKPDLIEGSGIQFTAGELASSYSTLDHKDWLAEAVVNKYIRNNSHRKMIKKVDKLIKGGVSNGQATMIDRWCRKVTLRNALIHNARIVNKELVEEWPEKYTKIGEDIVLEDGDVVRTHHVAYELAKKIDEQFQRAIIEDEDARILARVIYLMDRTKTNGQIAGAVFKILNYPFSKDMADSAIAYQKKSRAYIPDFNFMEEIVADCYSSESEETPNNAINSDS